ECQDKPIPLLIKPHPRSDPSQIEELMGMIPQSLRGSVSILEEDPLIACPVEVLVGLYDIKRVSGMASTGLLALKKYENLDVGIYSSPLFPKKIRLEIARFSGMIGVEPVEL
ncbi:MAG: alpha-2,8-polysialyltransferase family protein, partial [Desulfuromonadales bacterium]|nr:alpha-2,8-polysialyltransferase family protein [Desulfuromonadales bacterium]